MPWSSCIEFKHHWFSMTDQCAICSDYILDNGTRAVEPNSRQCFRLGTQYTIKHMLRHSYECCFYMCLSHSLRQFRAYVWHKPRRTKSLRLETAYTSYGAADKILRRLTAYEVCGGLWRLTATATGSKLMPTLTTYCSLYNFAVYGTALQASGVEVDDDCKNSFIEMKLGHKYRYIIYGLTDDLRQIVVLKTAQPCKLKNFESVFEAGSRSTPSFRTSF